MTGKEVQEKLTYKLWNFPCTEQCTTMTWFLLFPVGQIITAFLSMLLIVWFGDLLVPMISGFKTPQEFGIFHLWQAQVLSVTPGKEEVAIKLKFLFSVIHANRSISDHGHTAFFPQFACLSWGSLSKFLYFWKIAWLYIWRDQFYIQLHGFHFAWLCKFLITHVMQCDHNVYLIGCFVSTLLNLFMDQNRKCFIDWLIFKNKSL